MTRSLPMLIDALAAYRLTHFVTDDTVPFGWVRDFITKGWPGSLPATGIECPWCVGIYVAAGVVAARSLMPRWWSYPAEAFALSAVTGLLATWEHRD